MGDLGLVLVAGSLSLVGVFIGQRQQRSDTHHAWLRERRLQAYGTFLGAVRELTHIAGELYFPSSNDSALDAVARLQQEANSAAEALGMVQVLGPDELSEAGGKYLEAAEELLHWVMGRDGDLPDTYEGRTPLADTNAGSELLASRRAFIALARSELT